MSLKGSLEDFALPEVLQLLADTSKTGKLQISGHGCANGSLWFKSGSIVAFDVSASQQPSEAIFEMLRVGRGYFDFQAEGVAPATAKVAAPDRQDVREEVDRARAQLAEWEAIVAVVPSLDHRVQLVNLLKSDSLTINRDQWALVAAISGGQKISRILSDRYLGEYEGCKAIKDLVDAGLVGVTDSDGTPVASSPTAVVAPRTSALVSERTDPDVAPVAEVPEADVEATVAEEEPAAAEPALVLESEPVAEPEPVTAESVVDPEPVVVEPEPEVAEPEPVALEPEPVVVEPEPVVAESVVETESEAPALATEVPERVSPLLAFGLPTSAQVPPAAPATGSFDDDGDYVYRAPVAGPAVAAGGELTPISVEPVPASDTDAYTPPVEAIWARVDTQYTQSPDAGWTQADGGYAEPSSVAPETQPAASWSEPSGYEAPVEAESSNQDQFAELRAAIAKAEAEELAAAAAAMGEAMSTSAPSAPVAATETGHPAVSNHFAAAAPEDDGRSALRALLAEVTSNTEPAAAPAFEESEAPAYAPAAVATDPPDDALVDRGPWTSHELASLEQMEGWREDEPAVAQTPEYAEPAEEAGGTILPFRGVSSWSGEPDQGADPAPDHADPAPAHAEHDAVAAGEEPINRGLLLKFLSSVRN